MQLYNHLKPPSMGGAGPASAGGRVRMEMMGGAGGRGNMVPATVATLPSAKLFEQD
jgi:hypothetical protein